MAFPDPAALAKVKNMPVRARLIVEGALSGMHRARVHGSSIEFAEHKEYAPGDEIRHIDWKAYAKVDRYYVKRYEQESQLSVFLVLDASGSMRFGEPLSKLGYASHVLAALAYLLIGQRDRVGLYTFGNRRLDPRYIPPRARPAHLADLLRAISDTNDSGAHGDEPITAALDRIAEYADRRRALVVIASDLFEDTPTALPALRRLAARRHDVVLLHVLDRAELEFPFEGLTHFESLEDERRVLVNPAAIRREYLRRLGEFLRQVQDGCIAGGIDYHRVTTEVPFEQTLINFLTTRAQLTAGPRRWNS